VFASMFSDVPPLWGGIPLGAWEMSVVRLGEVEIADGEPSAQNIAADMSTRSPSRGDTKAAAPVFSRFLRHLAYLELAATTSPLPEMQWFPPTRAVT
jgi:hypothetical protein